MASKVAFLFPPMQLLTHRALCAVGAKFHKQAKLGYKSPLPLIVSSSLEMPTDHLFSIAKSKKEHKMYSPS